MPRTKTIAPDTTTLSSWLKRGEVAKLLNLSKTRVRQLEEAGLLHPLPDARGFMRTDPAEVFALAEKRGATVRPAGSRVLAHLLGMFRTNRSILEIKLATGLSTETIRRLYSEYRTPVDRSCGPQLEAREREAENEREHHPHEISR